jgi:hypothetical protein
MIDEIQLMKLVAHPQYVSSVKEEMIIINDSIELLNYCVI